ncbi:hypothetical protein MKEN_01044000 [Mycena kentingensis (nom. inval.)]|nr:hypothetical protein MKEN_01044000 [Mycena kentingensis (nom. inval.)]
MVLRIAFFRAALQCPTNDVSLRPVDIPTELIIHIITLSVKSCCYAMHPWCWTAHTLPLTCKWVADLVRAIRWRTIVLRTKSDVERFAQLVERALIPPIIRVCGNLVSLACKIAPLRELCRAEDLGFALPEKLHLTLVDNVCEYGVEIGEIVFLPGSSLVPLWVSSNLLQAPSIRALFGYITHLHLPNHHFKLKPQFPAYLMPNLTHFSMGTRRGRRL